jgi:4-carboxymuconolactone decarboxylase
VEIEARQPTGKGPAERFTGDVWVDPVAQSRPLPHRITAGIVRFAPGARTGWHVHALGQTLRVTDGIALVRASGGPAVAVYPGQTVYTPPGEWHWHGATDDAFMTHLALSETVPEDQGPAVTWGDHVTDAEYQQAHQSLPRPEHPRLLTPTDREPQPRTRPHLAERKITVTEQTPAQRAVGDFAPKLAQLTDDVLFGDVWERTELPKRDRSLITVASLITSGSTEQLVGHLTRAKENGLTQTELKEVIIHLAFYAGWPKAMSAIQVAKRVFAE